MKSIYFYADQSDLTNMLTYEKNGAIEPTARSFRATSTEERATP